MVSAKPPVRTSVVRALQVGIQQTFVVHKLLQLVKHYARCMNALQFVCATANESVGFNGL